MAEGGIFTISLDFELHWGVRDKRSLAQYGDALLGVRTALPAMLQAFRAHGIHATWATVGFLLFDRKSELLDYLPAPLPQYDRADLSPYPELSGIGRSEQEDPFHYGKSLVERILDTPGMELGSHTFSHYYCLESGQTPETFEADLGASIAASERLGARPRSIVFPRNQYDGDALEVCHRLGFTTFRGNQRSWMYQPRRDDVETKLQRGMRLVDTYLNASGTSLYDPSTSATRPSDVGATRFLRPYTSRLRSLDVLKGRRILQGMTKAAASGQGFHLWWHPHNFGRFLDENMHLLSTILQHFSVLESRYGMRSLSMGEVGALAS